MDEINRILEKYRILEDCKFEYERRKKTNVKFSAKLRAKAYIRL